MSDMTIKEAAHICAQTMTLEEAIKKVETAGWSWAISGGPGYDGYSAYVDRKGDYVGDGLSGPGVADGDTPCGALLHALGKETAYEKQKQSRS